MRVALALAIVLSTAPISASAKPARCLIEVDGRAYLFGQCNAMDRYDSGLSVGMVDTGKPSPYFASVSTNDDGSGEGQWNGEPGASHAQTPLGRMKRSGGCWLNERAKVCAWPAR